MNSMRQGNNGTNSYPNVRDSSAVNELLIQLLIDKSQVEELRELRQTISSRTVIQHGQTHRDADDNLPLMSPASSSSAYNSCFDGEDEASDRLPNQENAKEIAHLEGEGSREGDNLGESDGPYQNEIYVAPRTSSLPPQVDASVSPANEPGDVESNSNSTTALNLNLVHKLTLEKGGKMVAFSVDGKYLAVASSSGTVSIFDTRNWKRTRQVPLHIPSTRS